MKSIGLTLIVELKTRMGSDDSREKADRGLVSLPVRHFGDLVRGSVIRREVISETGCEILKRLVGVLS